MNPRGGPSPAHSLYSNVLNPPVASETPGKHQYSFQSSSQGSFNTGIGLNQQTPTPSHIDSYFHPEESYGGQSSPSILVPDLTRSVCEFCSGEAGSEHRLMATLSFTCCSEVPLSEQGSSSWIQFSTTTPTGNSLFNLYFRVASPNAPSVVGISRSCFSYRMFPQTCCDVHVITSDGAASKLEWNSGNDAFLSLEPNRRYTVQVYSYSQGETCQIIPYFADQLLTGLHYASAVQSSHSAPLFDIHGRPPTPLSNPKPSKKPKPSYNDDDAEDGNELLPDLDAPDHGACEISQLPSFLDSCTMGKAIGSCIFECALQDGHKNLRKKASSLEVTIKDNNSSSSEPVKHYIRFKVYADSTIRRGKRQMRRNVFWFILDPLHIVHLQCTKPLANRKSLKWTQEKKEHFLAFEAGMSFCIRVFSKASNEDCTVSVTQTSNLVCNWKDLRFPERSHAISVNEPTANEPDILASSSTSISSTSAVVLPVIATPGYNFTSSYWNMSLNNGPEFWTSIIASNGAVIPLNSKIFFQLSGKDVQCKILQFDHRDKLSVLFSVPRLFSAEKVDEVSRGGVSFSRKVKVLVVDSAGCTVWRGTFTYEVGARQN